MRGPRGNTEAPARGAGSRRFLVLVAGVSCAMLLLLLGGERGARRAAAPSVAAPPAPLRPDAESEAPSARLAIGSPVDAGSRVAPEAEPPPSTAPGPPRVASSTPRPDVARAAVGGRLVTADGAGLLDVPVAILDPASGEIRRTTSGLDGVFHLADVRTGDLRILVGNAERPFLEPVAVSVTAPSTVLDDLTLPATGAVQVRVVDAGGLPVAGARVRCTAHPRGLAGAVADAEGRAVFAFLPPGEGRVFARHPAFGRGNRVFSLAPGATERVEVRLRAE